MDERKLVRVERGNVVLRVPEDDAQRFVDQGYNIVDDNGNIIQASVPRDLGTLQKAYIENTAKINELEKEIQRLTESKQKSNTRRRTSVEK